MTLSGHTLAPERTTSSETTAPRPSTVPGDWSSDVCSSDLPPKHGSSLERTILAYVAIVVDDGTEDERLPADPNVVIDMRG